MTNDYPVYSTINSVESYLSIIKKIMKDWQIKRNIGSVIFRGQPNDKPLLPSVLRNKYNENLIWESFNAIYQNYTSIKLESQCEKMAFMQHYGFPTRLLDWTENALMSLFFAIDCDHANLSPVVWVLHVRGLNELTNSDISGLLLASNKLVASRFSMIGFLDGERLIDQYFSINQLERDEPRYKYPLAFYPVSAGNTRIVTQRGVFSIHGTNRAPIDEIIYNNNRQAMLLKIKIEIDSIVDIRNQLFSIGLTPRSVYPDLEGFSREIKYISLSE